MRPVLIAIIIIAFLGNISGQTLKTTEQAYNIDTLYIMPAVGFIACQYKREVVLCDSLNTVFLEILRNAISDSTKFTINYLNDDSILNNSAKEYLMEAIPRFKKLNGATFSKVDIGNDFERILQNREGRYFAFIYYQGFEDDISAWEWIPEFSIGTEIGTLVFSGDMLNLFLNSGGPYLLINFLIIDKTTRNFLFFENQVLYESPMKEKRVKSKFKKIINDI